MNVFEGIAGQEQVCGYLEAALASGRTTHAYLLVGAHGSGAGDVALRFAAALIARGDEGAFAEALRGAHPDLHVLEPGGTGGYLVEQVRELVRDAELAPVRAPHKVYIVNQADRLAGAPANALLKTLEEPPADVVCLLVCASERSVLETVRSRCEVLRLRDLQREQPRNVEVFSLLYTVLTGADNRTLLASAKRMAEIADEGNGELVAQQEAELERDAEFLTPGARKEMERRHKRELSARARGVLLEELAAVRSWLRDCLLCAQGMPDSVAHAQWQAQTMRIAADAGCTRLLRALDAAKACETRISYNVTPQLAMEALLFELREAVCR